MKKLFTAFLDLTVKVSDEIMTTQGLKQGCPLSPLLYSLFANDLGQVLEYVRLWGNDSCQGCSLANNRSFSL